MVLLVVALVGATTLAIGVLAYGRARTALQTAANTRLEARAHDVARDIHRELANRVADITTWARLETMVGLAFGDVDREIVEVLGHARRARADYVALVALDRHGATVAASGTPSGLPRLDAVATTVLRVPPPPDATLALATPVANPRDPAERLGTLVAHLDPRTLLATVTEGDILEPSMTVALRAGTRDLATTGSAAAPDVAVFERAAPVAALAGIDAPTPLTVHVRLPAAVALADVLALRATLGRAGAVVLLLSALAGAVVAWRVSSPIRRLTAAVEAITSHGLPDASGGLPGGPGEVGTLAAAFEAMLDRLAVAQEDAIGRSRLALVGEISASLAHDVRTPLSVLKTSAQLLASGTVPEEERRRLATMIAAEVDRLNGIVTDLVDAARPRPAERSAHPVAALVARAVAVLGPWARARDVEIAVDRGPDRLRVRVDGDQMQQALLNLVHNAVQATPMAGRVRIGWREDGGRAVIEVADGGSGFAPEALTRAFSPFFTTKPDGTGLGLAIVKRIVEEHGGEVGIRNEPGRGACVWCRLPRDEGAA